MLTSEAETDGTLRSVAAARLRTQADLHCLVLQAESQAGVICSRLQTCRTPLSGQATAAEA